MLVVPSPFPPLHPKNSPAANVSHGFPVSQTCSMSALARWTCTFTSQPLANKFRSSKDERKAEDIPASSHSPPHSSTAPLSSPPPLTLSMTPRREHREQQTRFRRAALPDPVKALHNLPHRSLDLRVPGCFAEDSSIEVDQASPVERFVRRNHFAAVPTVFPVISTVFVRAASVGVQP